MTFFPKPFSKSKLSQTRQTDRQQLPTEKRRLHNFKYPWPLSLQQREQHLPHLAKRRLNPPTYSLTNNSQCGREAPTTRRNSNSSTHRHIALTSGTNVRAGQPILVHKSKTLLPPQLRILALHKQRIHPTTTTNLKHDPRELEFRPVPLFVSLNLGQQKPRRKAQEKHKYWRLLSPH